jgi:hypothetical protein
MARTFSYAVKVLFAMGVVAITACSHHGAGLGGGVLPETSAVSNVHTLTALADGNSAALIDRRVSVEDRRVLQQFMDGTHAIGATRRTLQNTNIVLYDSVAGKFISNKPSLANSFRLIKKMSLTEPGRHLA